MSFSLEEVTGIEKSGTGYLVLTNSGRYESRAVILAMGADHRKPGAWGGGAARHGGFLLRNL